MAFFDWDNNGKKNLVDDFIEYKIYEDVMEENDYEKNNTSPAPRQKDAGASFIKWGSVLMGIVVMALIYAILGLDFVDAPLMGLLGFGFVAGLTAFLLASSRTNNKGKK